MEPWGRLRVGWALVVVFGMAHLDMRGRALRRQFPCSYCSSSSLIVGVACCSGGFGIAVEVLVLASGGFRAYGV